MHIWAEYAGWWWVASKQRDRVYDMEHVQIVTAYSRAWKYMRGTMMSRCEQT